jgi:glycosyltransferase involved in cell wall biosynthesis
MYGPHNFVFTNGIWQGTANRSYFKPHCFYNLLSDWIVKVQDEFGGMSLVSKAVPFPVDVDHFCPSLQEATHDCFVYFKGRNQELLAYAESRLKGLGLQYTVIRYGSYTEDQYLQTLRTSRFGIWIGSHESQGFALQEALSTNVPLVVWNVKSMFDEYNRQNEICYKENPQIYKLKATSVPYWDSRCGELFTEKEEFDAKIMTMSRDYAKYHPREFILETLSPVACYTRLVEVLKTIPSNDQMLLHTTEQAQLSQ